MKLESIILNISELENVSPEIILQNVKLFEKCIKSEVKTYENNAGLEDIKMRKIDYKILLELYKNTKKCKYKLYVLLFYIYSFYKVDGLNYNVVDFPFKIFFQFMKDNENIHSLIFQLIKIKSDNIYIIKKNNIYI